MGLFNKKVKTPGLRNGSADVYTNAATRTRESKDRDIYQQRDIKRGNAKVITSRFPVYFVTGFVAVLSLILIPAIAGGIVYLINAGIIATHGMDFSKLTYWMGIRWLASKPFAWFAMLSIWALVTLIMYSYMNDSWRLENIISDNSDINDYENDSMIQEPEQLIYENDVVPDAFAHYDSDVTAILSHMYFTNKGLKKWPNGKTIFDGEFAEKLADSDKVPKEVRHSYDPRQIAYNPDKERGKPNHDSVADNINATWTLPEYEGGRPGGGYVVDTGPSNTMVIASTRAGKGNFRLRFA